MRHRDTHRQARWPSARAALPPKGTCLTEDIAVLSWGAELTLPRHSYEPPKDTQHGLILVCLQHRARCRMRQGVNESLSLSEPRPVSEPLNRGVCGFTYSFIRPMEPVHAAPRVTAPSPLPSPELWPPAAASSPREHLLLATAEGLACRDSFTGRRLLSRLPTAQTVRKTNG